MTSTEPTQEDIEEKDVLVTRAQEYVRNLSNPGEKVEPTQKTSKSARLMKTRYIICQQHQTQIMDAEPWTKENDECNLCTRYTYRESLHGGILPRVKDVISMLMSRRQLNAGKHINHIHTCSIDISLQWIYCNVYCVDRRSISRKIESIDSTIKSLAKFSKKTKKYWEICTPLLSIQNELFDVVADSGRISVQEKLWGIKNDTEFYKNQKKNPPIGYCSNTVDRAWRISNLRKIKRMNRSRSESYSFQRADHYDGPCDDDAMVLEVSDEMYSEEPTESIAASDEDKAGFSGSYSSICENVTEESVKTKKRRVQVSKGGPNNNESLPENYRHIRNSIRSVRPEVYTAVDRMISELHMSKNQAVNAMMIVAKELFNIKWKTANEDEGVVDLDTVPQNFCLRKEGKAREVLALKLIVDKIMECNEKSTVTYHDDGSRKQGAGAFSVQGITINGKHYNFPTVALSSETRENLADLKLLILQLLSSASGMPPEKLWEKIDFTMTDAATHNLEVDDKVAEKLETDHVPGHLLCQVHPACMFTKKVQVMCKEIDVAIGPDKIFSTFAVSLSEVQVCVVEQWMDCVTRLVTHDFDHKAWNYADEFDIFIRPLKNVAKRLQKERFNSFVYTAAIVLWLDKHVSSFLNRFTNITNNLACIVRSFENLDYIRVLAAVIVAVGIHLLEPYLSLTTSSTTTWEKLMETFPTLYDNLISTEPEKLLDFSNPAFSFISKQRFDSTKYDSELLKPTTDVIEHYKPEIIVMLRLLLPKLAKGWSTQRGAIFDFGDDKGKECKLKIASLDQEKLKKAPVHNLSSERAVGSVNYGLKVYGNKQLKAVSSSLVKASASQLLDGKKVTSDMRKLVRRDGEIPEILEKWEEKQRELRKKGMDEKEVANIAVDKQRNADLAKLVKLGGPFTDPVDITSYMEMSDITDADKNKRLYLEVRYAKNTSVSFPKSSEVFRLKKNHKNLLTKDYCLNLTTYLKKVSCSVNMEYDDFKNALIQLGDDQNRN